MGCGKVTKGMIAELTSRIQGLFRDDEMPWVVGYSGGKDSTAALQLVWYALLDLPVDVRNHKPVHVISTDTLVEQPVVAAWVNLSLQRMQEAARVQNIPIEVHRLTPRLNDTYWVNLIGRGYPAPRPTFRWCTARLKIEPSNRFILEVTKTYGETVLVLGTRKAESTLRAANMQRYERHRTRQWLSPNASLPNSWIFSPIEDWSNDDVWLYLMQYENPWGHSNKDLLAMYRGASPDNDCPLVLDTSVPSCGNSRFGCWVCTLVSADKSMEAMVQNDDEKAWMMPLLEFRNEIGVLDEHGRIDDRDRRDYRRMNGRIKLHPHDGRTIPGPYTKRWREYLLRRLLEVEREVQAKGPPEFQKLRLVTDEELREIRRIWVIEKHEFDDALPLIYESVTGIPYPYTDEIRKGAFGRSEWKLLEELCGGNGVYLELQSSLLDLEQQFHGLLPRKNMAGELERVIRRCYYKDEHDAAEFQRRCEQLRAAPLQLTVWDEVAVSSEEGFDSV